MIGSLILALSALGQTALDVVGSSPVHTTLAKLATSLPPITDVLKSAGPLTLFAPTDDAFHKLKSSDAALFDAVTTDAALLSTVLQYHVLAGTAFDPATASGQSFVKTANGENLGVNVNGSQVTLSFGLGKAAVTSSAKTSNGVVHIIDTVLVPPSSASKTAVAAGLTSLADALTKQKLVETVDGLKDITIFAPTNQAFTDLVAFAKANNLSLTDAVLSSTLKLHVVTGTVFSTDIVKSKGPISAKTVQGETVSVSVENGQVLVSGAGNKKPAKVVTADVLIKGGVVHVIDTVLLPKLDGSATSLTSSATALPLGVAALLALLL